MGARQSSFAARSNVQDDGEHESGGPASPASYTIEPIPQGLEHVVYPKYEEAFRLGLAAFSHPLRTNKFKRELPPILGSAEFHSHPSGGITPLPATEAKTTHTQKASSAVTSTEDILNSNLQIAAYGSNGEFPSSNEQDQQSGSAAGWENVKNGGDVDSEQPPKGSSPPSAKNRVVSAEATKLEKISKGVAHTRSTSRADSTLWHSASSGGLPDSPTPSSINMEPSRFTIPIHEQNDRLYSPVRVGAESNRWDSKSGSVAKGVASIAKASSADLLDAPTPSTSAPGGYGIKKESPLLEALSLSFANGGLFDADEDFAFEISKLRGISSASLDRQLAEEAAGGIPNNCTFQQHPIKTTNNGSNDSGSEMRHASSTTGSRKDMDDLQLLESVYEEIRQWQYGRDPRGDHGL